MPTYHRYPADNFPSHLAYQRLAFIRLLWVDYYVSNPDPDYRMGVDSRMLYHDVYVQNDALVSAVSTLRTTVTMGTDNFVCYGISAMLTYPFWRKHGYGGDLIERATASIREQADADIGLLWTSVPDFYRARGWEIVPGEPAIFGDPQHPTVRGGEYTMMLFLSERSQMLRERLQSELLYVGRSAW
jgi:GNAT superfamily N-acetyltransferase